MRKFILFVLAMLLLIVSVSAQKNNHSIKGHLKDTLRNQPIDNATISLVDATDSSLTAFTRSDTAGNFLFKNIKTGMYRLSISHTGFHPSWKNVMLENEPIKDMGEIILRDKSLLPEVVMQPLRPPVQVNGDTLEFNAEAFKTKPNAVVEDMLKKMPGIQVDKDGTIRVNGQKISKVYVNGKLFFGGNDPKLATRNLDADAIDKIQVFEKKTDQAEFTGVDDGKGEKAINLKTKKEKQKMKFGKITAGAGTHDRYDGQFNMNQFNGDQQISVIGMANNTNRQGFTFSDVLNFTGESQRMMAGGGGGKIVINTGGPADFGLPVQGLNNSEGIAKTMAGGINFNNTFNKKTEISGSYFYNDINLDNNKNVSRQNLSTINPFVYNQQANTDRSSASHRFNFTVDSKLDSFNSIRFTPQLTVQQNRSSSNSVYESVLPDSKFINSGFTNATSDANGFNYASSLLYRHKFKKKGRTFSANVNTGYNNSKSDGTQQSMNNYYDEGNISDRDTLDQINNLKSTTSNYGINMSYTEPLSKKALFEFTGFFNRNNGYINRKTFDLNSQNGKHDLENDALTNAFKSEYTFTGGGTTFRTQQKKMGFDIGAVLRYASLKSLLLDENNTIKQQFTNLLPSAGFNYNFSKNKTFRARYTTSTQQPTTSQLQPVKDISDPLNIKQGNPDLKQEYQHSIDIDYFSASPFAQRNFFAFVNFSTTQNAIVNADVLDNFGARTTTYQNVNGQFNLFGGIDWGFKIKPLNTRLNVGVENNLYNSFNFLNAEKNRITNIAVNPRVSLSYNLKEILDASASFRFAYNEVKYSLQPAFNDHYWRNVYELETNVNLPWHFSINNEFTYSANTGRSQGYNRNVALWNAAITKGLFKYQRGTVKLSAYDLLNQNIGISRNANLNYIEDIRYKVLNRFIMFSFTYNLSKSANSGPNIKIRVN